MVFLEPGTGPLTISKLRSVSTNSTLSLFIVFRLSPMCPGIFLPFKTLPGSVPAPIEPTALPRSPCPCVALPPLNPQRRMPP